MGRKKHFRMPYIQILRFNDVVDGRSVVTISGYVAQYTDNGWIEGVNGSMHQVYSCEVTFEEVHQGRQNKYFELNLTCDEKIQVNTHQVWTFTFVERPSNETGNIENFVVDFFFDEVQQSEWIDVADSLFFEDEPTPGESSMEIKKEETQDG